MHDFILLSILISSCAAWAIGGFALKLTSKGLGPAGRALFECLGFFVLFFFANMAAGTLLLQLTRGRHWPFDAYLLNDWTFAIFSILQAILFRSWRERG